MRHSIQSVRVRATLAASCVSLVVLTLAAVLLVSSLRQSQLDTVDSGLELRAVDIESLLDGGAPPASVAVESEDGSFVQILDAAGGVLASSANIDGEAALAGAGGEHWVTRTVAPLGDVDFRVYTRSTDGAQRFVIIVGTSLDGVQRTQNTLIGSSAIGLPVLVAVLATLTWVVVGRALRPVEDIRRRVDDIGGGQLDRRVPVPRTDDEIGRLAVTMNRMLDRLEDAQRRQARFVSDASHELRTPIAIIRHELEVALEANDAGPERWRATAREVLDEDLRMQRLVDDLLFVARHDHHGLDQTGSLGPVDLDDLVISEAGRHSGQVNIDLSGVSAGQVRGTADHLGRVISNLFDNAVGHAVSTVAAHVTTADGIVTVHIDDDGPGIPEGQRDEVFERFARSDESRTRERGGAGLGLAIARDIVVAHHGTISAHRSPWLGGARMTVTLPDARS